MVRLGNSITYSRWKRVVRYKRDKCSMQMHATEKDVDVRSGGYSNRRNHKENRGDG
jgi:hypothetical protein